MLSAAPRLFGPALDVRVDERWPGGDARPEPGLLFEGENLLLLEWLRETYAGGIDLIYVDPPFATGGEFTAEVTVGTRAAGLRLERPAYTDHWASAEGYLSMLRERLTIARELLSERGSLYVHLDHRACAKVRLLLDELFGPQCFINEIIWAYRTGGVPSRLGFGKKHDNILFYVKDPARAIWNPQRERSYLAHRYGFSNVTVHEDERGPYTLVACRDVFEIPALRGNQPERVAYPTQKPEALLERIVRASSEPGSLVLDFFCGSGTSLVVAARLGRRFIGCDRSAHAVRVARRRLTALSDPPRLHVMSFGGAERRSASRAAGGASAREVRTRAFVAHGVAPSTSGGAPGAAHGVGEPREDLVHGVVEIPGGRAAVHFAPDTPLGTDAIRVLAREARARGFPELHLLSWEFDEPLPEPAELEATVVPFQLARELLLELPPRRAPLVQERPRVELRLERDGARRRVRLLGVEYRRPERLPRCRPARRATAHGASSLAPEWSDSIEEWAIDVSGARGIEPLVVAWSCARGRGAEPLPLVSPWLEPPAPSPVRVQLVTVHGIVLRALAMERE